MSQFFWNTDAPDKIPFSVSIFSYILLLNDTFELIILLVNVKSK